MKLAIFAILIAAAAGTADLWAKPEILGVLL